MGFFETLVILSLFFIPMLFLICIYKSQKQRTVIPTDWPILGMIPGVLLNVHRLHEYVTELLIDSGGTFMWKGPWFTNMDMLITSNPLDIHHILTRNFWNYPKGENFRKIFDILGDGIFNSDGELWEIHRKVTMSVFKHAGFQSLLETTLWNKVEKGLLPVLESISRQGKEMDLQEIFQRHVTPSSILKLQQVLRVGNEKKISDAWKTIDHFIYNCLNQKSNEYNMMQCEQQEKFLVLTAFMRKFKDNGVSFGDTTKFLRDTLLSLMVAGKDSTSTLLSWFFYILAQNSTVEDKILEEIHTHLDVKLHERWKAKELGEMVYLHGALSECLRLFPPLPFNHKSPLKPDILPSGHQVDQTTKIIVSYYSMGKMKSIWGEDCMEFKPERWITKGGGIKHEPSYKFPAFNAGPRSCVGKDLSLTQVKIVAAMVIYHYHIEPVKGHLVLPAESMVLQMKHGLKVRVTKRTTIN
ncbi:putative cytochrome P450 [Helianthus annuus]|nr:putative cytochrome P450 [Helianthus annuus]